MPFQQQNPFAAGNKHGDVGGNPGNTTADKAFGVLNALGDIAVAYNFTPVLVEIQVRKTGVVVYGGEGRGGKHGFEESKAERGEDGA